MKDLYFNENLQPVWLGTKDYETISGSDALEQVVRFKAIKRTHNISSEYQDSLIPQKIEKEIREIARNLDFIDSVVEVDISREKNRYIVDVKMSKSDGFNISLDTV